MLSNILIHHLFLYSLYFAPFQHPQGILDYFFGNGIGTNIGASIIWGFIAGFVGYFIAKKVKRAWAGLHARIDVLHEHHLAHHEHINHIIDRLDELHDKVDNVGNASQDQIHQHEEPEARPDLGQPTVGSPIDRRDS